MGGGQEPPDKKQELIEQQPEHADFDTDGHMHGCLFDKYDNNSECNKNCAAWSYALWTRELERSRLTPPLDTEELEKQITADLRHTLKLVPSSQRELFVFELARYMQRFAQHTQVAVEEAELVERFRKSLMRLHSSDWSMETISEAAHICAKEAKDATS